VKRKLHIQARQERTGIYKTRLKAPKPGEHVPVPQEAAPPLLPLAPLPTMASPRPVAGAHAKPARRRASPALVAAVSGAALLVALLAPVRSAWKAEHGWMSPRRAVAHKPLPPPPPDAKVWAAAPVPRSVPVPLAPAPTPALAAPPGAYTGDMPLFDDGRVYVGQ
jgi:hypothetical protein